MPRATFSLCLPETVWIGDVSSRFPDTEFTVLAGMPVEERGVGLLEINTTDIESVVSAFGEYDTLTSLHILETQADRTLAQFETDEPLLLFSLSEVGIPLEFPITIVDQQVLLELSTSREHIAELEAQLTLLNVSFELVEVRQSADSESVVTDEQYELLETAADCGYYDTPRTCTLTELAENVGLAKSTTSEKLHRAESAVLKNFLDH
ncbi:helix-turn-helix domain-containing protein [Haloferax sp. DFSO60]|uniref:helix-turn-helix domain-containing protein n=1 Tax=Haloferax sp. DFSO60 TaxID=3388652 RepID=UPI00397A3DEE